MLLNVGEAVQSDLYGVPFFVPVMLNECEASLRSFMSC